MGLWSKTETMDYATVPNVTVRDRAYFNSIISSRTNVLLVLVFVPVVLAFFPT